METLDDEQRRALAFVASAARGGYDPTAADLDAWGENSRRRTVGGMADLRALMDFSRVTDGRPERLSTHLVNLRWLSRDASARLRLTPLGQALLKDAQMDDADVRTIVLGTEDPLAYASLIRELAKAGDALLVDPYLDPDGLLNLIEHTQIRRVLVKDKLRKEQRAALEVFWKGTDRAVDIRVSSGLHDRLILAEGGEVMTIGTSLNAVAKRKSTTVLAPLPREAAEFMRKHFEDTFKSADSLVPNETEAPESDGATQAPVPQSDERPSDQNVTPETPSFERGNGQR